MQCISIVDKVFEVRFHAADIDVTNREKLSICATKTFDSSFH